MSKMRGLRGKREGLSMKDHATFMKKDWWAKEGRKHTPAPIPKIAQMKRLLEWQKKWCESGWERPWKVATCWEARILKAYLADSCTTCDDGLEWKAGLGCLSAAWILQMQGGKREKRISTLSVVRKMERLWMNFGSPRQYQFSKWAPTVR